MTQAEAILHLLRERGRFGLTPGEALDEVGTFRLAARIKDLRDAGHDIETQTAVTRRGAHVARYVLHEASQLDLFGPAPSASSAASPLRRPAYSAERRTLSAASRVG